MMCFKLGVSHPPRSPYAEVRYKAAYGAGPGEREPLRGDHDRLGAVGGIGAGAVNRKKLLRGKIAIDVERARKLSTRTMNLAYDPPPARARLHLATRDVYDDAAGGAEGGGQLTDRSDAGSWRSGYSAPMESARSVKSNTSDAGGVGGAGVAPPIGFSDVGSLKGVTREEDPRKKATSRGALREAAMARDADDRAAANRRETASAWVPDASDPSDSDEETANMRWRNRVIVDDAESSSGDDDGKNDDDESAPPKRRTGGGSQRSKKAPPAGIAGGAKVSGRGLRDPGWDTDSEERLEYGKMLSGGEGGETTDDDGEFVPLNKNRVR